MNLKPYLLALAIAGCGDNTHPDLTWADAEAVWSTAWCDYAKRCNPDAYAEYFTSDETCFDYVYDANCTRVNCTHAYPDDRFYTLRQCETDMGTTNCTTTTAPTSCYAAFKEPPLAVPKSPLVEDLGPFEMPLLSK